MIKHIFITVLASAFVWVSAAGASDTQSRQLAQTKQHGKKNKKSTLSRSTSGRQQGKANQSIAHPPYTGGYPPP
ncbi:MAG TPA: hypothetical protein VFP60_10850 [Pseudolabrys sp.]|nr:hypothetical protein [Pseudolabrys sp.]